MLELLLEQVEHRVDPSHEQGDMEVEVKGGGFFAKANAWVSEGAALEAVEHGVKGGAEPEREIFVKRRLLVERLELVGLFSGQVLGLPGLEGRCLVDGVFLRRRSLLGKRARGDEQREHNTS